MDAAKAPSPGHVDLHWIPVGAGGHLVHWNAAAYEALAARREQRRVQRLFHSALEIYLDGGRYVVEMAPVWNLRVPERGAVVEGPVGSRLLGRSRWFRYEVRCWRSGLIPDKDDAVATICVTTDPAVAIRLLETVPSVPALVWGRDELGCGDMWNSNSLVSWLLARSGADVTPFGPPFGGRAPGWRAGLALAALEILGGDAAAVGAPLSSEGRGLRLRLR